MESQQFPVYARMLNLTAGTTTVRSPMADAPTWEGIVALLVTVFGLGTYHVPIRTFPAGDGFFVQWSMSIGVLCTGFVIHATLGFPGFEPIAVLGGMFWAIANALSQRVISGLGLAVGLLLWNATNCLTGWFIGRFGLFGVTAKPPQSDVLNASGLFVMLLGSFLISFVKKIPRTDQQAPTANHIYPVDIKVQPISHQESITSRRKSLSMPDLTVIEKEAQKERSCFTRHTERFFCIALALVAGFFYGLTPVPVVYIEDNHAKFPNSPRTGLSFMFSMFFGILLSSTVIFFVYVIWKRNRPQINPNIVLPSICGGIIWGLAMSGLIAAIDIFGQTITYPITTTVPGVVASLWSIFYFKEINQRRNYILLGVAFVMIGTGAILVFLSKIKF